MRLDKELIKIQRTADMNLLEVLFYVGNEIYKVEKIVDEDDPCFKSWPNGDISYGDPKRDILGFPYTYDARTDSARREWQILKDLGFRRVS